MYQTAVKFFIGVNLSQQPPVGFGSIEILFYVTPNIIKEDLQKMEEKFCVCMYCVGFEES